MIFFIHGAFSFIFVRCPEMWMYFLILQMRQNGSTNFFKKWRCLRCTWLFLLILKKLCPSLLNSHLNFAIYLTFGLLQDQVPGWNFSVKIMWHLIININGIVYLADAMGLCTWWKHVKVCLRRLFIKTTKWNTRNLYFHNMLIEWI